MSHESKNVGNLKGFVTDGRRKEKKKDRKTEKEEDEI